MLDFSGDLSHALFLVPLDIGACTYLATGNAHGLDMGRTHRMHGQFAALPLGERTSRPVGLK